MPELLLYAIDTAVTEPGLSTEAIAGRMKLFDLVTWKPDGWGWGEEELKNPCFRLVSWPSLSQGACESLMGAYIPEFHPDGLQTEYSQPRSHYMNLSDPRIAATMPAAILWWRDATRSAPMLTMPDSALMVSDVIAARPAIPIL